MSCWTVGTLQKFQQGKGRCLGPELRSLQAEGFEKCIHIFLGFVVAPIVAPSQLICMSYQSLCSTASFIEHLFNAIQYGAVYPHMFSIFVVTDVDSTAWIENLRLSSIFGVELTFHGFISAPWDWVGCSRDKGARSFLPSNNRTAGDMPLEGWMWRWAVSKTKGLQNLRGCSLSFHLKWAPSESIYEPFTSISGAPFLANMWRSNEWRLLLCDLYCISLATLKKRQRLWGNWSLQMDQHSPVHSFPWLAWSWPGCTCSFGRELGDWWASCASLSHPFNVFVETWSVYVTAS